VDPRPASGEGGDLRQRMARLEALVNTVMKDKTRKDEPHHFQTSTKEILPDSLDSQDSATPNFPSLH
jgi:hypothetical protein